MSLPTDEKGLFEWALKKMEVNKYGKALKEIVNFGPDPKRHPNLFQLKVTLLYRTNKHKEAFDAAKEYVGDYDGDGDVPKGLLLTDEVAGILGHAYAKIKEFKTSFDWYTKAALLAKKDQNEQMIREHNRRATDAYALYAEQLFPVEGPDKTPSNKKPKQKQIPAPVVAQTTPLRETPSEVVETTPEVLETTPEVVETTTTPVPEAPEPPSIGPIIWEFSKSFKIDEVVDERLYLGTMDNSVLKHRVTLMKASSDHVLRFEDLVSLRDGDIKNPHIVRVDTVVEAPNKIRLLVCESITTVDAFFKTKMDLFLEKKGGKLTNNDKADWYKNIEYDLNRILSDVLLGLMTLFPRGYCCEDLTKNMFVTTTTNWEAKILPALTQKAPNSSTLKGQKSNVEQLKRKIRHLIRLPFKEAYVDAKEYKLSTELVHLFETLTSALMNIIPGEWLLFQPLVWNLKDRFEFIQNLRSALKRGNINEHMLNEELKKRNMYWDPKKLAITWPEQIKEAAFIRVFQFPAKTGKLKEYTTPLDIQRYINAVYGHVNDGGESEKKFSDIQIDDAIRQFFPEVYTELHKCLIESTKQQQSMTKGCMDDLSVLSKRF